MKALFDRDRHSEQRLCVNGRFHIFTRLSKSRINGGCLSPRLVEPRQDQSIQLRIYLLDADNEGLDDFDSRNFTPRDLTGDLACRPVDRIV